MLGNLLAEDGKNNVAVLYQNDSYGTGLNAVFKETFEASGGTVVEEQSYNTGDTTFDAQISAILGVQPRRDPADHVRRDLHDRPGAARRGLPGREPVPRRRQPEELQCAGRHATWPAGLSLEGAKGTTPAGPAPDEDFQARVSDWWVGEGNAPLTDFSYANESYDAVILLALASLAANSTDPAEVAGKLQEVSGGSGDGEKCTEFKECADIILGGGVADYDGYSGPITFDDNGDPTEATIGVFQYGADNKYRAHRPLSRQAARGPGAIRGPFACRPCAAARHRSRAGRTGHGCAPPEQTKSGCRQASALPRLSL